MLQFDAGGMKYVLCDAMEEGPWRLASDFLWTSPHVPFPFADFYVFFFLMISHSHKDDHVLISVRLHNEL